MTTRLRPRIPVSGVELAKQKHGFSEYGGFLIKLPSGETTKIDLASKLIDSKIPDTITINVGAKTYNLTNVYYNNNSDGSDDQRLYNWYIELDSSETIVDPKSQVDRHTQPHCAPKANIKAGTLLNIGEGIQIYSILPGIEQRQWQPNSQQLLESLENIRQEGLTYKDFENNIYSPELVKYPTYPTLTYDISGSKLLSPETVTKLVSEVNALIESSVLGLSITQKVDVGDGFNFNFEVKNDHELGIVQTAAKSVLSSLNKDSINFQSQYPNVRIRIGLATSQDSALAQTRADLLQSAVREKASSELLEDEPKTNPIARLAVSPDITLALKSSDVSQSDNIPVGPNKVTSIQKINYVSY